MAANPVTSAGPVAPTATADVVFRPAEATITGGFWADRQETNRAAGLPDGSRQLQAAGNLENLANAAKNAPPLRPGSAIDGSAAGLDAASGGYHGPLFMDSDVYKWLEAAAWETQRQPDGNLAADQKELTGAVAAAQRADGYLNSFVQLMTGTPWADLKISHELYCAGHLFQGAVAARRSSGDTELLDVARRFADLLTRTFGPGQSDDVDGHPIVEMALVELFRETGEQRYLDLARFAVEARGRSEQNGRPWDFVYFSDRVPVREASSLEGHAVRALYLASGATDVAIETGDKELLAALERQWEHVTATKTYITGGMGARWEGEAFGNPFELPTDRAYAETCAAIASIQWSWRLLLATGRPRYADLIERTLFNGMLAGVSLQGTEFFYANVLQLRAGTVVGSSIDPSLGRQRWFSTACCPPNVMRTLAQLQHYLSSVNGNALQVHQYASGAVSGELENGTLALDVDTAYPYQGTVTLRVTAAPAGEAGVWLRIPAWAEGATAGVNGNAVPVTAGEYLAVERSWTVGDVVELRLPMAARVTSADPRVDAVRGCVAVERGPLVYCLEQADQGEGVDVDLLTIDLHSFHRDGATEYEAQGLPAGTVALTLPGGPEGAVTLSAVPYALWANRGIGPMKVWIPASS